MIATIYVRRGLACAIAATGCAVFAVVWLHGWVTRRHAVTPPKDAVFTSTRYITSLAVAPNGDLWAGTLGGVLRRTPDGRWRKFTVRDGLPSHEVRSLTIDGSDVVAQCATGTARLVGDRWLKVDRSVVRDTSTPLPNLTSEATYRGRRYAATVTGLYVQAGPAWIEMPLPHSIGTHISALLPSGDVLLAAMFGDGLWAYDGRRWKSLEIGPVPASAREITALAEHQGVLWIGTRRAGLWERTSKTWVQHLQPEEPISHNCEAHASFRGDLFVSTLEDGLAVKTAKGWGHFGAPAISSNAPRQMAVYRDRLYLRHSNGKLDRWDGRRWDLNIGAKLPRRQVSALAADADRLYAAQWGGWSEFDGENWTHHLDIPELQGLAVTALGVNPDRLWIGTQNRGLAEYDRRTGSLKWHDERRGLPDDWITALAPLRGTIAAGTFVGGLALSSAVRFHSTPPAAPPTAGVATLTAADNDTTWTTQPELSHENVTALESDGTGGLFVATRTGVWRVEAGRTMEKVHLPWGTKDVEAQCLCRVQGGLWVGTRTGLYYCARP